MSIDISRKRILPHLVAWILYIFYEVSILIYVDPGSINCIEIILAFLLNAMVFYVNADFILVRLVSYKLLALTIVKILLLISLYLVLSYWLSAYIFPFLEVKSSGNKPIFTKLFFAQHIWRAIYFLGLSTGYWLTKKTILSERKLRSFEREQYLLTLKEQELKKQIAMSHLAFIKSQVNPHFLHNTLNFFYSNIYPLSKPLAESLLRLSEMMRFTFDHTDKDGLVELAVELKQIENYITLNQLRFSNNLQIVLNIKGNPQGKRIISFLLMALVENAFKYGDLQDAHYPLSINVFIDDDHLQFKIMNKKKINANEFEGHGIGIKSLENQLKLMYADNYELNIENNIYDYRCILALKFQ
ncbi:MAG: yehU 6 [Mucilaginibacter sp.]|nr:yehU 6 [Mucilaginibacter sp.]